MPPQPSPVVAPRAEATTPGRPLALRLIMLEKLLKSVFVLVMAVVFFFLLVTGTSVHLHGMATRLREHVTAAWSVYVANAVLSVTERRHLAVATGALFLDGVTTGLEWYALKRGKTWGEWLVVGTMASLLPFEVVSFVREHHTGRLVVLVGNLLAVGYLVYHVRKKQRREAAAKAALS